MLKKGQQKLSTRLYDRVIVRERVQKKSHNHIHESRTFSKGRIWSKLTIALISGTLTERRNHLVFRHCPKTIITKVIRKLNLGDMEHIRNNLRCDNYARTSNASNIMRY